MIQKEFKKTSNHPVKALFIWDGECAFCHYWVIRLKNITGNAVNYEPFQKIANQFPEMTESEFRRAVMFIDISGNVYSGAAAAFKTLEFARNRAFLFRFYMKNLLFRKASELIYKKISGNRPFAYKLTVALWGKDPSSPRPYWLLYVAAIFVVVIIILLA